MKGYFRLTQIQLDSMLNPFITLLGIGMRCLDSKIQLHRDILNLILYYYIISLFSIRIKYPDLEKIESLKLTTSKPYWAWLTTDSMLNLS